MRRTVTALLGRKTKAGPAFVFLVLLQPALLACPVCFQVEQNATTRGVQAAVLVLIAVTTVVLTGFGMFIVRFVRRS